MPQTSRAFVFLCLCLPAMAQQSAPDFLKFIQPDAQMAAGFEFKQITTLLDSLIAGSFGPNVRKASVKGLDAAKEIDRVWISANGPGPNDMVALLTGHFDRGAVAELIKKPGVIHVLVGGSPQAMLVGAEPAVKAALLRLKSPTQESANWVAAQARLMAPGHDFWLALEPRPDLQQMAQQLNGIRQFSFGMRLHDQAQVDGELVADSSARLDKFLAELEQAKARMLRQNPKARAVLDNLALERVGQGVRFSIKGGKMPANQISAEIGQQFRALFGQMSRSPGASFEPEKPSLADDKLKDLKKGMTRAEVVGLVGRPLNIMSISGLDEPRETWTYRLTSGKTATLRLENGIVTAGSMF